MPPTDNVLQMLLSFFKCCSSPSTTGGTYCNADCCITIGNENITTATNLVHFGPVTSEILWLICMGGDCREANICSVLVKGHSLGGSNIASL